MVTKAHTLKHLIYYLQNDLMRVMFCDFDFKHRLLKQKLEMLRHIAGLQRYVNIYEQRRVIRPLQFLSSIKRALSQIQLKLHTSQLSMTESLNKVDVMESLSSIQITERGNRRVGDQCLLKLMYGTESHQSLTLTGVCCCYHISCVTSDWVWVSDVWNNLILTDKTEKTNFKWRPRCVYWSPSTGDLLVGMYHIHTETGKVTRYNGSGQLTQTIQRDKSGRLVYSLPNYITENNNGDVVVSDSIYWHGAVVVTERGGRHRFSYTGHSPGSELMPCGICTDSLSHILVCDYKTKTVHMLHMDGQFLSHLLTGSQEMGEPRSLSYDVKSHRLWVGSWDNNKVCVYRYITRQDALTDQSRVMESLSGIPIPGTEKAQYGNQCLPKLTSPLDLLHFLIVKGVRCCYHISCVTSDRVWVSDRYTLTLTDTTGATLHNVEDSYSGLYRGLHTVNKNNNGDVVVSDYDDGSGAVVVTERGGRHRFSYTGRSSRLRLKPRGICTDELSHILDGLFLSYLLTRPQEMDRPWSLNYDFNSHRLWVGSLNNSTVCIYSYIIRQAAPTEKTLQQKRRHFKETLSPSLLKGDVFPLVTLKGCALNWTKAVWTRVQQLGLVTTCRQREGVHSLIRQLDREKVSTASSDS
ncbi:uncharacterized protein LOC128163222 [Crassostrea angulata]|uniref:uncharacterized protein LOC128163222 n=1 Tax=Magallana angulata TaxID=2784310 RepID=UPI0022B0DF7E|nr:uncharacterized protein LOC128163222 [Crassostrea angulata]